MSLALIFFIIFAVGLIVILAWVLRPPRQVLLSTDEILGALSEERHYARLPQILQALREDDTDFLRDRGRPELLSSFRAERRRIAMRYLDYLEEEYQVLLEAGRIIATMAPELSPMGEFERYKRNLRFILCCRYLRWRLRLGLQPWNVFGTISDMAGEMTLQLEAATARLGERAAIAGEFPSTLENRSRHTE
jgi:hypothetical protein